MSDQSSSQPIPLAEEELAIGKTSVVTGKVRVHTRVQHLEKIAEAELERETVEVTRVPVDREINEIPHIRTEGDLTVVPVVEEVLVVEKRLFLKEEIHLRRRRTTEVVSVPVEVRKQQAEIERIDFADHEQQEKSR
jgi:uncharacterized protein (TIGR02271 family)